MPATDLTPSDARIPPSRHHGSAWPASATTAGTPAVGTAPQPRTRNPQKCRRLALSLVSAAALLPLSASLATTISDTAPAAASTTAIPQDAPMAPALTASDISPMPPASSAAKETMETRETMEAKETTAANAVKPRPDSPPALVDSGLGLMQVILSLGFIIGLLLLTLWLLKRLTNPQGGAGPSGSLVRLISAAAIGQRERVVIVEVADTWLVLGVAAGQISKLHELPRQDTGITGTSPATMHDFANRLKQLLGQRHDS